MERDLAVRQQGDGTLMAGFWFIMVVEQFVELRGPGEQGDEEECAESEEGGQAPDRIPVGPAG
ncbi:MAG: hypothetical protein RI897_1328 [Verrucomicrobiota bacterium]